MARSLVLGTLFPFCLAVGIYTRFPLQKLKLLDLCLCLSFVLLLDVLRCGSFCEQNRVQRCEMASTEPRRLVRCSRCDSRFDQARTNTCLYHIYIYLP